MALDTGTHLCISFKATAIHVIKEPESVL